MIPAALTTALTDGLADAISVAGLVLLIVVGVALFKYMRKAVGDSPWDGYTIADDVNDRAISYQADRSTFDSDGNYVQSDSKKDFSDAAKDVIRRQKHF